MFSVRSRAPLLGVDFISRLSGTLEPFTSVTGSGSKHLMERDDPSRNGSILSGEEDIMSVHDSSDVEMVSAPEPPEHHSKDSSLDSGSEGEHSNSDHGSHHHSDSHLESDCGSTGSDSESEDGSSSSSNDSDGGIFRDMFSVKQNTINLDSHVRYLEMVWEDKSLYPNHNVVL